MGRLGLAARQRYRPEKVESRAELPLTHWAEITGNEARRIKAEMTTTWRVVVLVLLRLSGFRDSVLIGNRKGRVYHVDKF